MGATRTPAERVAEAREKVRNAVTAEVVEYQRSVISHTERMARGEDVEAALDAYRDAVRAEAFAEMRAEMLRNGFWRAMDWAREQMKWPSA